MAESYALVRDGVVVEIVHVPDGSAPLQHLFHASVIAQLHRLTEEQAETVKADWLADAGAFLAPPAPPAPVEISPAVLEPRQAVARAVLARATKERC